MAGRHNLRGLIATAVCFSLAASCDCGSKKKPDKGLEGGVASIEAAIVAQKDAPEGLYMRLREGDLAGNPADRPPLGAASKLAEAATEKLLARLPAFAGKDGDQVEFALRPASQPPPRTGETITTEFPPPVTAPPPTANDSAPLEIIRFSPEGDVPIAPHLSVTFSQPMVAVTSHRDASANVPVELTPQPPGQWRWVGTRTILFDPEVRFPQATEYKVEIAAGTKSMSGTSLAAAKTFAFRTPPPTVKQFYPTSGPHKLDPFVYVAFDQKVDPAMLIEKVKLVYDGEDHALRLASAGEIGKHAQMKAMVEMADKDEQQDRYLVMKPKQRLPKDTSIQIVVPEGTPSAEGPRVTETPQLESFQTYGPLSIREHRCGYGGDCPPSSYWYIEMSNPLDPEKFDPDAFVITPELPGRSLTVSGQAIYIHGAPKGRTKYEVKVPATLTDVFEQGFGREETLEFDVGPARPTLSGPNGLVVLDPYAETKSLSVFSINQNKLKVRIHKVKPSDWDAFALYMYRWRDKEPPPLPGKKVFAGEIDATKGDDELVETAIDLSKALDGGIGHAVVIVEPTNVEDEYYKPRVQVWVQATNIGLDAFADGKQLLAWTTELRDGKPAGGVDLEITPQGASGKSGADGSASIELPSASKGRQLLIARRGKDVAFLPEQVSWWSDYGGWYKRDPGEFLRWMVFDDRGMYRPKEQVHVKGWIRKQDNGVGGDISGLGETREISYQVIGSRGNEITKGTAKANSMGGFDLKFTLPDTPNLGMARIQLTAAGTPYGSHTHTFDIQEFRRPEYEVTVEASQGPFTVGTTASLTASATYYSGGGLPAAPAQWQVTASPTSFTPPNQDKFTFGRWVPWWTRAGRSGGGSTYQNLGGTTTSDGKHVLDIDFLSAKPPQPYSVNATASVTDVNRQSWSASTNLVVHPSELYVGIRRDKYFVDQGKPIEFDMIVVDQEGKPRDGVPISTKIVRVDWKWKNGRYEEVEKDEQRCDERSAPEPVSCSIPTLVGGTYRITATVVDDKGRPNETSLQTWVSGGKRPPARNVEREEVTLVPDKETYKPGDTAQLLVMAPFDNAEGVLTIRRSGIVRSSRFTFKGTTHVLEVPIRDGDTPNLFVNVDVVGKAKRLGAGGQESDTLPARPAYGGGQIKLSIPPEHRTLNVEVTPEASKLEPGGKTSVGVVVKDATGKPVSGAEVAVVVVDESVLALSGYQTPNPIAAFYVERGADVRDHHSRGFVELARPDEQSFPDADPAEKPARHRAMPPSPAPADNAPAGGTGTAMALEEGRMGKADSTRGNGQYAMKKEKAAPKLARAEAIASARKAGVLGTLRGPSAGEDASPNTPIAARTNFNALAAFAPDERTNGSGHVSVDVTVPDNLTRYRVMVAAVDADKQFGAGESSITARMPIMVRPSPPRFLNFGDKFEMPIVVQNQTDEALTIQVALRSANAKLTAGGGREVKVAANDRVEVRFPAAAVMPGTARFQVGVSAGKWADAKSFELPVWTPATTEAFATYGSIDDKGAMAQPVKKPSGGVDAFGGLEISTSSTQLQALTDAVLYLYRYPYECSEQLSSRILAIAALRDVLDAFEADGLPSKAALESSMKQDIERLRQMQNYNGGFGFWTNRDETWPFLSTHVAHAMARAKHKGYPVPESMLSRSRSYLQNIESYIPHLYSKQARWVIIAYSLYVRKLLGDVDTAKAKSLIASAGIDNLPMGALGWLLYTLGPSGGADTTSILRQLNNRATETAGTASFANSFSDGGHLILHSSRRADAIILEALLETKPKHDLVEKLVRGLLAHRKRGKWLNTQENVFVLLAMDKYFGIYEKTTPNFTARAWLGDQYAGDHAFRGRTTERHRIDIPMKMLSPTAQNLTLQRDGRGRMYYRIGMRYAPEDLTLDPADHGFAVERVYEHVDDPGDVQRDSDGTWVVKAGARVRVRLTMAAESRRYHVALVDPLPAGLEPLNPALKVTGPIPADPQSQNNNPYWWWSRTWYEHQNMRDERVEAFASLLWAGVHEYTYVATATTPGTFVVPPTKAEEMYAPETFGRSGTDTLIVK